MKAPRKAHHLAVIGAFGPAMIIIAAALIIGAVLAWWGGSTIFADAVAADLQGTRGELTPLPLLALVVGICAIVWGVCALAWRLATALHTTTPSASAGSTSASTPADPQ